MMQATAESASDELNAEEFEKEFNETIEVEIGPEGTSVTIDDPGGLEVLALILVLATAIAALLLKSGARLPGRRKRKGRGP